MDKYMAKFKIGNDEVLIDRCKDFAYASKSVTASANAWTDGASITINKAGVYCIDLRFGFGAASTTGTRDSMLGFKLNGTLRGFLTGVYVSDANTSSVIRLCDTVIEEFTESDLPCTVTISGFSTKASVGASATTIRVIRLTDIVGGNTP